MPRTVSPQLFDPAQAGNVQPYLERILQSEGFRKAPNLRNLLEYLVARSNEGHTDQLKESVIAIEVFGRRTDFDGRIDNIVRVQAHRMRKLLEIYYSEEGKNDKLRLTVPRGGYIPHISMLEDSGPEIGPAQIATVPAIPQPGSGAILPAPAPSFPWARAAILTGVFFAGSLLMLLAMQLNPGERQPQVDPAVSQIWRGIFDPGIKLIVSYTNPVFLRVGRSRTYLLYQGPLSAPAGTQIDIADTDPAIDKQYVAGGQPLFFSDGWTGTGEVLGVNRLTEVGTQFKQSIDVIPSRALSLDEVRSSNVIFLGSPWLNGVLAQIGNNSTPIYNTNDGRIVVRNPRTGEKAIYENGKDPRTSEIKSCYALFSVLPGLDASRSVVSSAGIGTWATWGAIDFLTTPAGAAQVVLALKAANGNKLPRFYQVVIGMEIIKGATSNASLIATRVVQTKDPARR